jgi:hypothetical protein
MKYLVVFILILISMDKALLVAQSTSQLSKSIQNIIQNETNFDRIVEKAEAYFNENPTLKNTSSYKHWARWAYYHAARLDSRKQLVNVEDKREAAIRSFRSNIGERASAGEWESIGPSTLTHTYGSGVGIGRVDRIAFHPTNANIYYIGTPAGGLFKTTNDGVSWQAMTDALTSMAISGIVISSDNSNKIYILTGDGDSNAGGFVKSAQLMRTGRGVFVSNDAGENWTPLAPFPTTEAVVGYKLIQSPIDADILLAATNLGIFKTINGGNSWELVNEELTFDIEYKIGSGTIVFASHDGAVSRSGSSGNAGTWTFAQFNDFERIELAVTPANDDFIYFMGGDSHSEAECGGSSTDGSAVYRSNTSSNNFTRIDNGNNAIISTCCDGTNGRFQVSYDHAFAVSVSSTQNMIAGGVRTWRSNNGGVSWLSAVPEAYCETSGVTGFIHDDIHMLIYHPITNELFACTDGGLYTSATNGTSWTHKNNGIVASQIYHLATTNVNNVNMMIGLQDNGMKARDANNSAWEHVLSADGFDCMYNWNSSSTGLLSWNRAVHEFSTNGDNLNAIIANDDTEQFFKRVATKVGDNNKAIVGSFGASRGVRIFQKNTASNSWSQIFSTTSPGNFDIERCPTDANKFYFAGGNSSFATSGAIKRTSDFFETNFIIQADAGNRVTDIAVKPNDDEQVWYCIGGFGATGKVMKSNDSGATWIDMSANLPLVPMFSLAIDANGDAYVGTDIGIFYRSNAMNEWIPFSHKLPIVPVTDLEITNGKLIAATFGRGVWRSDLYSTCIANATVSVDLTGRHIIETSQQINATNQVFGGASSDVIFKAGNQIALTPGFHVKRQSNFHGYIRPCKTY